MKTIKTLITLQNPSRWVQKKLNHWIGQTIIAAIIVLQAIIFKTPVQTLIVIGILCAWRGIYEVNKMLSEQYENTDQWHQE